MLWTGTRTDSFYGFILEGHTYDSYELILVKRTVMNITVHTDSAPVKGTFVIPMKLQSLEIFRECRFHWNMMVHTYLFGGGLTFSHDQSLYQCP